MSTRSFIGKQGVDGSIRAIYCHGDGYPEGVGSTLFEFYQDEAKIDALLDLGDLSALGAELGKQHDFDGDRGNACRAYGRDRGESNVDAKTYSHMPAFLQAAHGSGAEYAYVFIDGRWFYTSVSYRGITFELHDLSAVV